jgi:hypothetical protein
MLMSYEHGMQLVNIHNPTVGKFVSGCMRLLPVYQKENPHLSFFHSPARQHPQPRSVVSRQKNIPLWCRSPTFAGPALQILALAHGLQACVEPSLNRKYFAATNRCVLVGLNITWNSQASEFSNIEAPLVPHLR